MTKPVLFLSHAGSDTEAARKLRDALLRTELARKTGLRVWFDKEDMVPGEPWQLQVERVIQKEATAFVVYVGLSGVINWVDAEVRLAQLRAIGNNPPLRFIPVLSSDSGGVETLPGFTQQFQAVQDVETNNFDNENFRKLLAVVVDAEGNLGKLVLEADPFFGLEPIRERHSHLFFGRDKEVCELTSRLDRERLLLIVGDSGSGKSSLVQAGLLSAWRGGVVAERSGRRPNAEVWHVVQFRPRSNPRRQLHQAVSHAARILGRSPVEAAEFARLVKDDDADTVRTGLRCGLDPENTRTLLFVDQFEELVIQTPEHERRDLAELLLNLADTADPAFTVVMTMRSDYANLLYGEETRPLYDALNARADARYTLRGVTKEGLEQIVRGLLRLAGRDNAECDAVVRQVSQDVGERPGDLALLQFALTRMWETRHQFGDDLVEAYVGVGGVRGALAREAERVYENELGGDEYEETIASALIRLGRLGDVGGITRRVALRSEFSDAGWTLMQRLASTEGNRLVLIGKDEDGNELAEIAHEALLTQWDRLHSWLNRDPEQLRQLNRLTSMASDWEKRRVNGDAADEDLATGSYLAAFTDLRLTHPVWLSPVETAYIDGSEEKYHGLKKEKQDQIDSERELRKRAESSTTRFKWATALVSILMAIAGFLAVINDRQADKVVEQASRAEKREIQALKNESSALTVLANISLEEGRYYEAKILALSAWPRDSEDKRPAEFGVTWDTLARATVKARQLLPAMRHKDGVQGAILTDEGNAILSWSGDGEPFSINSMAWLWDVNSGKALFEEPIRIIGGVMDAHSNGVDATVLSYSSFGSNFSLFNSKNGAAQSAENMRHEEVREAILNAEGTVTLSWSEDGTIGLWDLISGKALHNELIEHEGVRGVKFNAEETEILSWSRDGTIELWDANSGAALLDEPIVHEGAAWDAQFDANGMAILSWSGDGTIELWDAGSGAALFDRPIQHEGVRGARFNFEETTILSWAQDGTIGLWDAGSGAAVFNEPIRHKEEVLNAQFCASGAAILSWSKDGTVGLWDTQSGAALFDEPIRHKGVRGARFNVEETEFLTWSQDGTIELWDAKSGAALFDEPIRHEGAVWGAQFDADGTAILSWSEDGTLRLWDASSDAAVFEPIRNESPLQVQFNAEGTKVLSLSTDGTVGLWDARTGQAVLNEPIKSTERALPLGAQFNNKETAILSWSEDGTVGLWDARSGAALLDEPIRHEGVWVARFNVEETEILTLSWDGTFQQWDAKSGAALLDEPIRHEGAVSGAQFDADGTAILSWSEDGAIDLWDARSGVTLLEEPIRHEGVWGAQFNTEETTILSWSEDGTVGLWDARSGTALLDEPIRHEGAVWSAQFNANEAAILSWTTDTLGLWDAHSGATLIDEPMRHFTPEIVDETSGLPLYDDPYWEVGAILGVLFNAENSAILSWSEDGTVELWDARSGVALLEKPIKHVGIRGAKFNTEETAILTWSIDGTLRFWDAKSGEALFDEPIQHEDPVLGAQFNPAGTTILSWSFDGTIQQHNVRNIARIGILEKACEEFDLEVGYFPAAADFGRTAEKYALAIDHPICKALPPWPKIGPTHKALRISQQLSQQSEEIDSKEPTLEQVQAPEQETAHESSSPESTITTVTLVDEVLFDETSAELSLSSEEKLEELLTQLEQHDEVRSIYLTGHTDINEVEDSGEDLSLRRVVTIREFLQEAYPDIVINSNGVGKSSPIATNSSIAGRQLNRRVEIQVMAVSTTNSVD